MPTANQSGLLENRATWSGSTDQSSKIVRPDDDFIVVVGMNGAGKSNFISLCIGEDPLESEGSLLSSYTGITMHTMKYNGRTVHLIETPAIDSFGRTEEEIFEEWTYWMVQAYRVGIRINGLVYLHNILDPRLTHGALCGLEVFKKMCGPHVYAAIAMATTRWDIVEVKEGEFREAELVQTLNFWGDLRNGHSYISRLSNNSESAMRIISYLLDRKSKYVLDLQREMVDERRDLHKTEAGKVLYQRWLNDKRELEQEKQDLQTELDKLALMSTRELEDELRQMSEDIERKMIETIQKTKNLQKPMEELTAVWEIKRKDDLSRIRDELTRSQEKLKALEKLYYDSLEGKVHRVDVREEFEKELKLMQQKVKAFQKAESSRADTYKLIIGGGAFVTSLLAAVLPVACTIM